MKTEARPDWIESVRRAAAVLGGIWIALWLARIVGWVADVDGAALAVMALTLAALGAGAGWANAKQLRPMDSQERRDAVLGWSIVGALVGALAVAALLGVFD